MAFFQSLAPVVGGIDWHSYSELILRPLGYSSDTPPHEQHLKAAGDGMRDAGAKVHGVNYTSIPSVGLLATIPSFSHCPSAIQHPVLLLIGSLVPRPTRTRAFRCPR